MAASSEKAKHTMEKHFAQHLAANETKIRDKAVKKLARWITARSGKDSGFNQEELLRIWKGLHYCMWMSDKMLVQEDLADSLSEMTHSFKTPDQGLMYFETFLLTLKKEWNGIDNLRVNKYLMLYRRMFRQALILLKKQGWQENMLRSFMDSLERHPFHISQHSCPDSLRFFLVEIYIEEISRIGGEELTREQVLVFLEPLVKLASHTTVRSLTSSIMVTVFEEIVNQAWMNQPKDGEEEEDEEAMVFESFEEKNKNATKEGVKIFEELPMLEFDHSEIKKMLLKHSSQPNIPSKNRKRIYKTIYLYHNLLTGCHPSKLMKEDKSERREDIFLEIDNPKLAEKLKRKRKEAKERKKIRRQRKKLERQTPADGEKQRTQEKEEEEKEEEGKEDGDAEGRMEDGRNGEHALRVDEEDKVILVGDEDSSPENVETGGKEADGDKTTEGRNDEMQQNSSDVPETVTRQSRQVTGEEGMTAEVVEDGDEMLAAASQETTEITRKRSRRKSAASRTSIQQAEGSDGAGAKMVDRLDEKDAKTQRTRRKVPDAKTPKADEEMDADGDAETKEDVEIREEAENKGESQKKDESDLAAPEEKEAKVTMETQLMRERKTRSRTGSKKAGAETSSEKEESVGEGDGEEMKEEKKRKVGKIPPQQRRSQRKAASSVEEEEEEESSNSTEVEETEAVDVPEDPDVSKRMSKREKRGERKKDKNESEETAAKQRGGKRKSTAGQKKRKSDDGSDGGGGPGDGSDSLKSGTESAGVDAYTPPVLRKRVKIALANNEELSSTDYHKRVKASPGIPFDKERKPDSPAIKPNPSPPKRTLRSRTRGRKPQAK